MKLTLFSETPPENSNELRTFLANMAKDVLQVVNGNLTFADNMKCQFLTVSFDSAGADKIVRHNLGRIPMGFVLVNSNIVLSVYRGSQPMTSETVTLRASAITTDAVILLF